jgi:sugar lactone lactonase YvrE
MTSTLMSSMGHTTSLDITTRATSESKWSSIGITVISGNGNSSILNPYGVAVDDQYFIYVAEKENYRISKWPPNPNGTASTAVFQTADGELNLPPSLYVKSPRHDIYVADESNNRVVLFLNGSTTGSSILSVLSENSPAVNAIYLDPNGTIFIGDVNGNRIYNWLTNETIAGGEGPGQDQNQFNEPKRFFIDSNYSLYIADANNNRVQKFLRGEKSGETVAGGYGLGSSAEQLSAPLGVVVDSKGNVIVCDSDNHRIQKWSQGAIIGETIAGYLNGTSGDGPDGLNTPKGIAIDKDDNLYVADTNNLRIQKFNAI